MSQKTSLALLLNGLVQNQNLPNPGDQYVFDSIMVGGVSGTALTSTILSGLITNSHAPMSDNQNIVAGNGLTGGGSGATVTLTVGAGNGINSTSGAVSVVAQANQGIVVTSSGVAVNYDDSSIGIASGFLAVLANGITNTMLAGSIADSKLNQLTTANKVAGSAVQLNSTGGLENNTGLAIMLDGSTLSLSGSGLKVNQIADAQIASAANIQLNKLAPTTVSSALVSDSSGFITASSTTSTELGYVHGVTSSIQTQFSNVLPLSGGSMSGAINMGGNKIVSLGYPTNPNDAASKTYVDTVVVSGGQIKEAILSQVQLSNTQGILPAGIVNIEVNPSINDTITVKNNSTSATWTFVASRSSAYQVTIGGDENVTMQNLATAISTDSTAEGGQYDALLLTIDDEGAVIVYDTSTASLPSTTRIYGNWTTQSNCKIQSFYGEVQYSTSQMDIILPGPTDPVTSQFGFGRTVASLTDGEIHVCLDTNAQLAWNSSLTSWVTLSGPSSIPDATSGVGGGVKGKATFDSSKGLSVTSGVVSVEVDNSSINFNGSGYLEVKAAGVTNAMLAGSISDSNLSTITTANKVSGSAVQLNSTGGLQNSSGLALLLNGSTLFVDGSGLKVATGGITNNEVNASAAIAESKLNLNYSTSSLNTAIGTKANESLNNLASVAINTDLLPASSGGVSLGSAAKMMNNAFLAGSLSLYNTSSATYPVVLVSPSGVAASTTFTLPAAHGTSGQALIDTTGGGVLGWASFLTGPIYDAQVASGAGIEYSKLALTNSIVNSDISSSAAIADSKLAQLTTANKVAGSAVQLASGGGLQNSSGLEVKVSDFAGNGLVNNGSNQLEVENADASLTVTSSGVSVNFAPNVMVLATAGQSFAANTTYLVRYALSSETAGRVYVADCSNAASTGKFYAIGIVNSSTTVNAGGQVSVMLTGINTLGSNDVLFSSANVGQPVYLTTGGGFSVTPPSTTGFAVWRVGMVVNTNMMLVSAQQLNGIN